MERIIKLPENLNRENERHLSWAFNWFLCGRFPIKKYKEVIKGQRKSVRIKTDNETEKLLNKCLNKEIFGSPTEAIIMSFQFISERR